MTLCISYKFKSPNDDIPRAICYADSRITTLGASTKQTTVGGFLPSNAEIKHKTDRGIKIQIVSAVTDGSESYRDFVFSIAGSVSLGLQSLIHLDSVFKTFYENYSFEQYIDRAKITLHEFWQDAWDQEIEYLMTATDDIGEIRIIYVKGTESDLVLEEIQQEDGLLLAVVGDNAEESRETIRRETNSLMCAGMEMNSALDVACVRMMRRAIENPNQIFIGGNIQACLLVDKSAKYLTLDDGSNLLFRSVKYSREWRDYPRKLNTLIERPSFPVLNINQDMYDPQKSLQEIMNQIKFY
ncbi:MULTISPECIES: hypothetical protein [unclassified Nostoc]|uniref:hypothetical protein n=1 Tax=unclassified Nostoc TaxID=2593658 RepID=UPI002AD440E5|nr:hypothetical protein [Nostoc sp. DedQUE03]MDZ7973133.1 hypothetical protein [Nostoc sp. DedQUE03]MDZ8047914.1 hypothetical protein [Nostoc sp. DedQUE02]